MYLKKNKKENIISPKEGCGGQMQEFHKRESERQSSGSEATQRAFSPPLTVWLSTRVTELL